MLFAKICIILISGLLLCELTEQAALNNTKPFVPEPKLRPDSDIGPQELVYLGSVDGATYYVDKDITRNWADAKKLCEGFDIKLKLAKVMSKAQHFYLNEKLPDDSYWIGAHDYMGEQAFRWEGTKVNPVNWNGMWIPNNAYWCLSFKRWNKQHGIEGRACTVQLKTLCQLYP